MPIIDYKTSIVPAEDFANKQLLGRINSKIIRMMMFTRIPNASWAAGKAVQYEAYPIAMLSFKANRDLFRLEVGDNFIFNDSNKGITSMIFRIINVTEEDLSTETIVINAVEDVEYLSTAIVDTGAIGEGTSGDWTIEDLTHIKVIEAPYLVAGNEIKIIPLAARETGDETGYKLYMSFDGGTSYNHIDNIGAYNPYGTLLYNYPADTYNIDDTIGMYVDFGSTDVSQIISITREQLLVGYNTALVGDEFISFQNITPVSGTLYYLSGIYRGRLGGKPVVHSAGEGFWYAGTTNFRTVTNSQLLTGSTRYFKMVPYNIRNTGDIATASGTSLIIEGIARKPYTPSNLQANGDEFSPEYTTDIILTWNARVRGRGAGTTIPGIPVIEETIYEGLFRVKVYVDDILMRTTTVSGINWTYTEADNISDNGSLAEEIIFKVSNYIVYNGLEYESDALAINVELI